MANLSTNLRKAAVLIRSLDGETAATLLSQLSAEEAAAIRAAIQSLGNVNDDEQADVAAELRHGRAPSSHRAESGVELSFSSTFSTIEDVAPAEPAPAKRFEFLKNAPVETIAAYLLREHVQTTALVLSHLAPARAAAVLGALPAKRQADTVERLSRLGESDPESVTVVERELAAWAASQPTTRRSTATSSTALEGILAAADKSTRGAILANLGAHNQHLAAQFSLPACASENRPGPPEPPRRSPTLPRLNQPFAVAHGRATTVAFKFDDLIRLSDLQLSELVRDVDPQLLVLALVGSNEPLIERITGQMPKRAAKTLRRQLRHLGPMRLSDVEAAQRAVADNAGRRLARQQ